MSDILKNQEVALLLTEKRRSPGRPRRSELRVPTDQSILTAASRLFMSHGYRAVTMDMVASAAGVTKAAVYYHFRDKGTLFTEMARTVFIRAREATESLLAQEAPLRKRMQDIASVVLSLPQPFTQFDAMMHEASSDLTEAQRSEVRSYERSVSQVVEEAMVQASASGEISAPDPILIAHCYLAILRVGQTRDASGKPLFKDTRKTAELLISALWDGITPPGRP